MNLTQQKQLIQLVKQYQQTDKNTINTNIKKYMDKSNKKPAEIAIQTGISVHTIRQLRKTNSIYKPDFITALILCDLLQISTTALLKPIPGVEQQEPEQPQTKWVTEVKKQFVTDYNSMDISELCQKYELTPRTAQEYNKNFIRDLDNR